MSTQVNSTTVNDIKLNNNVGYTVVGSPTIVDGVVSGFSAIDNLKTSSFFLSSFTNYEFVIRASKRDNNNNAFFSFGNGQNKTYIVINNHLLRAYIKGISTQMLTLNASFIANNYYYYRFRRQGNKALLDYSVDGDTFNNTVEKYFDNWDNVDAPIVIGYWHNGNSFFGGSIDLNNTYIKVNGITWFNGKETASSTVNEVYYNKNCGYTVVGSPTINNGIVSGFSQSSYCYIANTVNNLQITECICKINIPSSALGQNTYYQIFYGALAFITYSAASAFTQTSFYFQGIGNLYMNINLQPDKDYWLKYTNDGNNCTSWWSDDGINYTAGQSKPLSSMISQTTNTVIGLRSGAGQTNGDRIFPGSIDLNNTYIKVNGVTLFNGKQAASPAVNTLQINGNTVWQR